MKYKKIILLALVIILITGCGKTTVKTDAQRFKAEYENYNETNIKIKIDEDNIIKYTNIDKINKIIKEASGVIFIGKPKDNKSRNAIRILLEAADSTDLETIYYIDSLDKIEGINEITNPEIPLVINVLEGKITSYIVGTILDKDKLTEDDELELYNKYLDGIHEVLQDTCDEEC